MNPPEIENIHRLNWNGEADCTFTAAITNNIVTDLHFCEPPAKVDDEQCCMKSVNEKYLRQVMANLTEMFSYIDKERAKVGTFKLEG